MPRVFLPLANMIGGSIPRTVDGERRPNVWGKGIRWVGIC